MGIDTEFHTVPCIDNISQKDLQTIAKSVESFTCYWMVEGNAFVPRTEEIRDNYTSFLNTLRVIFENLVILTNQKKIDPDWIMTVDTIQFSTYGPTTISGMFYFDFDLDRSIVRYKTIVIDEGDVSINEDTVHTS